MFSFLSFLAEPAFVLPWYIVGFFAAVWTGYDEWRHNTPLKTAMKWAWPIIVFFFSIIGLALYLLTARAPDIDEKEGKEKEHAHHAYERNMLRRVNGAVIHCVAGDGLGIMSGMVIARVTGMSFWQEFWFEYAVGFAFGLFIFQLKSMKMMTDSTPKALAMAFRAEFFSMLTVMAGMGAVMTYVTPSVIGAQPSPWTYGFWGFGMFGLLVGFVLTFPMNWMLVKIGWKHGMGAKEDVDVVEVEPARVGIIAAMAALGAAALVLPAWLTEVRETSPCPDARLDRDAVRTSLADGTHQTITKARDALRSGDRTTAMRALDGLRRLGRAGKALAPENGLFEVNGAIGDARHAIQNGDVEGTLAALDRAAASIHDFPATPPLRPTGAKEYAGATLIDTRGEVVGEVVEVGAFSVKIAIGGARDVWGFVDLSAHQTVDVALDDVAFAPRETLGPTMVVVNAPIACAGSAVAVVPM